jgi:hypothetical protein
LQLLHLLRLSANLVQEIISYALHLENSCSAGERRL